MAHDRVYSALEPIVTARFNELCAHGQVPTFSANAEGLPVLNSWTTPAYFGVVYRDLLADLPMYGLRIQTFAANKAQAMAQSMRAKREVVAAADVEMADTAPTGVAGPGPSTIQSMVDKAVAARMKKLEKPEGKGKGKGKGKDVSLSQDYSSLQFVTYSSLLAERQEEDLKLLQQRQTTPRGQTVRASSSTLSTSVTYRSLAQPQIIEQQVGPQAGQRNWFKEGERQGEARREEVARRMSEYRYGSPSTLPDLILTLDFRTAVQLVILNTPLDVVAASKFKTMIHVSPGVNLPIEISHMLSVGARYMFFSKCNSQLIWKSWMDFQRRLRWRLLFSFRSDDNITYDPDYDVKNKSVKVPTHRLPKYIELGLIKGRIFVRDTISKIPESTNLGTYKPLEPKLGLLKSFLLDNKYVVTGTDKNLGIAVSESAWIRKMSLEVVSNTKDYKVLSKVQAEIILNKKHTEMITIAEIAEVAYALEASNLPDFLRSKLTKPGAEHHIPVFYGIPKIHKYPVKFRPIIPCHSAVQNPAAKFVSKKLKPIINKAPTVIHGTKDLAIKLSKLHLQPGRKLYIVTGDVVAFYPNVQLDKCLDIVFQYYMDHYFGDVQDHDSYANLEVQKVFRRALHVANEELITQYDGQIYQQLRGLAMGVADSPDLANLYGCYFEDKSGVIGHPLIPYYGRYIDDCFALVYASSENEALGLISSLIKYDGCVIEWSASDKFSPFLDMCLFFDEFGKLQHMPYRKAGNHQERIPWISHHPLDVKRGTFIGEMSRLATLSSTLVTYLEALKGLVTLYVVRGYPEQLVKSWCDHNIKVRWESRLREAAKAPEDDVLVLKTEFNMAWNYFNANELGNTLFKYWRDWLERADRGEFSMEYPAPSEEDHDLPDVDLRLRSAARVGSAPVDYPDLRKLNIWNRRLITSRKRTQNLYDLTNLWKKVVLQNLDELLANPPDMATYETPRPRQISRSYSMILSWRIR